MIRRKLGSIASIGLLALAVGNAAAEAAVTSVWIAEGNDHKIHVTAITDAEYEMGGIHTAYATAKIVSPSGRTAEHTEWAENWINAQVTLDIGSEDGTFIGYNWQPKEWCPINQRFYYPAECQASQSLAKWVAIFGTSATPSTIGLKSSQGTFRVTVQTSTTCSGSVNVLTSLIKNPPQIDAGIRRDRDGSYSTTDVVTYRKSLNPATSTPYDFIFGTNNNNTHTGTLTMTTSIDSAPCQVKTVSGVPLSRTIKVQ